MEHEAEFEELVHPPGSDYEELLRHGGIRRRVGDIDEWRREIRAKCRADRLRVRTFAFPGSHTVYATLIDRKVTTEDLAAAFRLMDLATEARDRARLYGHRVEQWIGTDADTGRAAGACADCGARLYAERHPNAGKDVEPILEGEVFDAECPSV